ncbi:MAG: hypothetical protein AB3N33_10725 [Puniceicoccaceae bacterium]
MILKQSGQSGPSLPEWIEACWKEIPEEQLPETLVDGIDCLEQRLRDWPAFSQNGHGCFLTLEQRACFFAYAEGTVFRRISRLEKGQEAIPLFFSEDWMQQTRMLFKSRTGLDLCKVLVPQADEGMLPSRRFGLVFSSCQPKDWPEHGKASRSLQFLARPVSGRSASREIRHHPILERRLRSREQTSVFRSASFLLLGGWLLLLFAACRSGEPDMQGQTVLHQRWEAAAVRWENSNKAWKLRDAENRTREAPFRVAGSIIQSVPEGILLDRLSISDGDEATPGHVAVALKGTFKGEEDSPVFRSWIRDLQERKVLSSVENLRFNRREDWIHFQLSGPGNLEGDR